MKRIFAICLCLLAFAACEKPEKGGDDKDIHVASGVTIYGKVLCGTTPLKDVVVSDGVDCVQTDADGVYQLKSAKKYGYAFVSLPSGYRAANTSMTAPVIWKNTAKAPNMAERLDFALAEDGDQTEHVRIVFGDIHLYDDGSVQQFKAGVVNQANTEVKKHKKVYGLTMGDMTWDYHWYDDNFKIINYLSNITTIKGMQIFNTVGNHDHDMKVNSLQEFKNTGEELTCQAEYRKYQGPSCYSCNIGKVHYVSLDDVITTDDGTGTEGRGCARGITDADYEWLKKDLSYVSKDYAVVVSMHIPLYDSNGDGNYVDNTRVTPPHSSIEEIVAPFKGFSRVIFLSAHKHIVYNKVFTIDGQKFEEWNVGATCGYFWNTAKSGLNVCATGAPGGFKLLKVNGTDIQGTYQAWGKNENYFFRSYDRNEMDLSQSIWCPNAESAQISTWEKFAGNWIGKSTANYVYFNVWDYKDSWKIEVTENGKALSVEQTSQYDPMFLIYLVAPRCNKQVEDVDSFSQSSPTLNTRRFFRVKASSATSTVTIKVTDEYGNSHVEEMKRPKSFSKLTYENEK